MNDAAADPRLEQATWLVSPEGQRAVQAARAARQAEPADPLRAGAVLRAEFPLPAELAAAALAQAELTALAIRRHGIDDDRLLLTRDGLEAATRPMVADRRAAIVAQSGARHVLDLTGGLGFDTAAFLRAGLSVTSVERDPATAALLRHNCPAATVVQADATSPGTVEELIAGLQESDVVFVDPARRDPYAARDSQTARARPERDPERWSPPWRWVVALPHPRVAAKVSPTFTPPDEWVAEWVSLDRTVVECALYSWGGPQRAAIILRADHPAAKVAADAREYPTATEIGPWLHEVDSAVLSAGAIGALAQAEDLRWLGPGTTWLTGDDAADHAALRSHRVVTELSTNDRQARRQLSELGVISASVKCRDVHVTPRNVLRALKLQEGPGHVVIITTADGRVRRVLAETSYLPS